MKKISFLFILYCSFLIVQCFGQNRHTIDSLQNKLRKFEDDQKKLKNKAPLSDSIKANILIGLCTEYWGDNYDTAMMFAQRALTVSEEIGYKKGKGNAFNCMGVINLYKGNYPLALDYYHKSLKIYEEIGNRKGIAASYQNIGGIYDSQNKFTEALKNYVNSLQIYKEIGDKKGIAVSYSNMGNLYETQGNYAEALKNLLIAIKMQDEIGDKRNLIYSYNDIGNINMEQGNYQEALKNNLVALKISKETGFKYGIGTAYNFIGLNYYRQKNYPEALKNYLAALKVNEEIGNKQGIADSYYYLGGVNSDQGNYPGALKNYFTALKRYEEVGTKTGIASANNGIGLNYERLGNLKDALKYESKGLSLAFETGSKSNIIDAYKELARIYAKLIDYKAAYDNEVLFKQYYDTLFNNENEKKLTSLQMQFDFDKKQQTDSIQHASENKINLLNLHRQKEYTGLGIAGFILVVLLLFFVYLNYKNQRKATAEMAIARQRAEQSEKFKEQFLANMSHEIRTPMNAVMGMTNLVLDSTLNEKQRFYLEGIRKSSDTLLHIINDILDLSKIEAGKMEMENIDFSLADVLDQVKQTLQHKAEEKGLQLIVTIDSSVPGVLMGDPVRVNQVLMNLAGNAIKFTEKGSVTISVSRQPSAVTSHQSPITNHQSPVTSPVPLTFSISDTGIGIPEDKLQSVFESFTQAKTSDTRRYGGTGLGLTISKQLVELMDGKISIESKEGLGTTFSFEINFPVGSAERLKEQRSAEEIDGSILDGLRILLADDNEYNRIVTHDTLQSKARLEISEATNGKEVIEFLSHHDYDVVLMDVQMPVMDGYEATRYIREKFASPKNQVQIIALTASVIRSDLGKCRDAGMNDYIPKPFKASQLFSVIAKATGRESRYSKKKISERKKDSGNFSRVTDLEYLEKFCEGDEKRMQKYVDMFLASVPYIIDNLNIALNNRDWPEIAGLLHGNKTKLMMMGMNESKDLAGEIEIRCRQDTITDTVKIKLQNLIQQIESAKTELTKG